MLRIPAPGLNIFLSRKAAGGQSNYWFSGALFGAGKRAQKTEPVSVFWSENGLFYWTRFIFRIASIYASRVSFFVFVKAAFQARSTLVGIHAQEAKAIISKNNL